MLTSCYPERSFRGEIRRYARQPSKRWFELKPESDMLLPRELTALAKEASLQQYIHGRNKHLLHKVFPSAATAAANPQLTART